MMENQMENRTLGPLKGFMGGLAFGLLGTKEWILRVAPI